MSETISISTGIAARYATALFDLARDDDAIGGLEADVDALTGALRASPDFSELIRSPVYSRAEQEAAIGALATRMGVSDTTTRALRLMANKRRLFVLPQFLTSLRDRIAAEKGVITAEVVSATPLTKAQLDRLTKTLKKQAGRDVRIDLSVDESLIGGLRVKLGSRMIDTSIRSRLDALQNMMKEAG